MQTDRYCQSCAMPIGEEKLMGTEQDGSLSKLFCTYCYQSGGFTQEVSMDEMIEICVPHMVQAGMAEPEARKMLNSTLPTLSRWK